MVTNGLSCRRTTLTAAAAGLFPLSLTVGETEVVGLGGGWNLLMDKRLASESCVAVDAKLMYRDSRRGQSGQSSKS
jgi:hypothetical protein